MTSKRPSSRPSKCAPPEPESKSEVIEDAVRRDLGLDLMERLSTRNDMPESEAMELALEAQLAARLNPKR